MKLISWNIARREEAWRYLLNSDADLALLQEATQYPGAIQTALLSPVPPDEKISRNIRDGSPSQDGHEVTLPVQKNNLDANDRPQIGVKKRQSPNLQSRKIRPC